MNRLPSQPDDESPKSPKKFDMEMQRFKPGRDLDRALINAWVMLLATKHPKFKLPFIAENVGCFYGGILFSAVEQDEIDIDGAEGRAFVLNAVVNMLAALVLMTTKTEGHEKTMVAADFFDMLARSLQLAASVNRIESNKQEPNG